jgi:predicted ATP-dependent endonuclease of OLD family
MIHKITIDNFRSIKYLELEALNLCAIVGANSSGKSNVLKAIDLVLGEGWTTKAKVAKELFNDTTKPIKILIELNDPISWTSAYSGEKSIKFVSLKMELTPLNCEIRLWEKFPSKQEKPSYLNEEFKKK